MSNSNKFIKNKQFSLTKHSTVDLEYKNSIQLSKTIKLPALRQIHKGIKYNDLSYMTERSSTKLRKQVEQVNNIQQMYSHQTLINIKQKLNSIRLKKQQLLRNINIHQLQKQKLRNIKNSIQYNKNQAQSNTILLNNNLNDIKGKSQQAQVEVKVYQSMIERLKHDQIILTLRQQKIQSQLSTFNKQHQTLINKQSLKLSQQKKSKYISKKFIIHIQNEQSQRQNHLNSIQQIINTKRMLKEEEEQKNKQIRQISTRTLQQKTIEQKKWYNVYLCNKFIGKLLRDKMNRQMMRFNEVESAFKQIKIKTGINNCESMIQKCLNKQNTYGQLLQKISQNQDILNNLKYQNSLLLKQQKQIIMQRENLNIRKMTKQDFRKEQNQYNKIAQKSKMAFINIKSLQTWVQRSCRLFEVQQKQEYSLYQKLKKLTNQLIKYTNDENELVKQLQKFEYPKIANVNIEQNGKNSNKQNKTADTIQQQQFIDNQRDELIRNNQKFMKQLKRKVQQFKKSLIESEPKKIQKAVFKKHMIQYPQ